MDKKELRDHFAGLAMAALIAKGPSYQGPPEFIVKQAYDYADIMLKESGLNQAPKNKKRLKMEVLSPD